MAINASCCVLVAAAAFLICMVMQCVLYEVCGGYCTLSDYIAVVPILNQHVFAKITKSFDDIIPLPEIIHKNWHKKLKKMWLGYFCI